jgi:hypothetical protein
MTAIQTRLRVLFPLLLACAVLVAVGGGGEARGGGEPTGARLTPLTSWENVLLGRWVAIETWVGKYSRRHGIPARWTMMTFASESVMNPLAKGLLPGDRGLGQVGFNAEAKARASGSNPRSRYYEPDLDRNASIWEPKTNTILAVISYQRIYQLVPEVETPQQAYAVYTYGPDALLADGTIRWDAQQRVDRALSFRPLLSTFRRLKALARTASPAELRALVPDPMTRSILAVDRVNRDGQPAYDALARRYLRHVATTGYPWVTVIFGRAALDFLDVGRRVWHADTGALYARLERLLLSKAALFVGEDADLVALYEMLLVDVRGRSAG